MNTALNKDVVKELSDECHKQGLDFGVYLSPWDMHEKTYATPQYDDFFCRQLTELLTNYGDIFEVWFDGAKGAQAKAFEYDWERYYKIVRTLQPYANISICGPDLRWVGNEGGKCRKSEFSVVPQYLTKAETIQKNSQQTAEGAALLQKISSRDEDLGSREVLSKNANLCWYPAEVDVSIRKGWFYPGGGKVKSARNLFNIYINSVGNNCSLLLNVPPNDKGVISKKDMASLKKLGKKIANITANPLLLQEFGKLKETDSYLEFKFNSSKKLKYCVIQEDITYGQRVEKFDLYVLKSNGKYKRVYDGTVIGSKKIIKLKGNALGALFIIRQSRSTPYIKQIGFYE
jgi:alpha-L-fucosidase